MNITQKKYAINRSYEIIIAKCKAVIAEVQTVIETAEEDDIITLRTVSDMLRNNELKLLPKSKIKTFKRKLSGDLNWDLADLYDFTALKKQAKKSFISCGVPEAEISRNYEDRFYIQIKHPDRAGVLKTFDVYSDEIGDRIKAAKALLEATADAIMLSSEKEALDRLKALSDTTI